MKHLHTKLNRTLNYVTAILIVVVLLSLMLPYFNYPGEVKDTCSMAGFLGFPQNFEQLTDDVVQVKNISIKQLYVPLVVIIFGIIVALICVFKSGLPVAVCSTLYSAYCAIMYIVNPFMGFANMFGKWVTFVLLVVVLGVSIVSMIWYIRELKNRKDEDYISLIDG